MYGGSSGGDSVLIVAPLSFEYSDQFSFFGFLGHQWVNDFLCNGLWLACSYMNTPGLSASQLVSTLSAHHPTTFLAGGVTRRPGLRLLHIGPYSGLITLWLTNPPQLLFLSLLNHPALIPLQNKTAARYHNYPNQRPSSMFLKS